MCIGTQQLERSGGVHSKVNSYSEVISEDNDAC